ncbi:MAG: UMP kinase [Clostridiales bacterium]|nr:UMP kinase [Clostridiales bacterium]
MAKHYQRIMLKLSGEALGKEGWLFDHDKIDEVAAVLKQAVDMGVQLGIVIGGGNLWRGRLGGAAGMDAVTADQMGMLGTVMNCLCMKDALTRQGVPARVMTAFDMPRIAETYRRDLAVEYMKKGEVVLFAGGLGHPFFTTDSAVALRAAEIAADAIFLAKNIDGVYSSDPRQDANAVLIKDLSYDEALKKDLKVMDQTALLICRDQKVPFIRVFGLDCPDNILKVLSGDEMGSLVHP